MNSFAEIIIGNTPTLGKRLLTIAPSAAGANNDFTGSYTDIDDAPSSTSGTSFDITDNIISNTVGDKFTSNFGNIPASITGFQYELVTVVSGVRNTIDSNINDMKHVVRSGAPSVEVSSAALNIPKDSAIHTAITRYLNNPIGGGAWTKADIDASEFGVETI